MCKNKRVNFCYVRDELEGVNGEMKGWLVRTGEERDGKSWATKKRKGKRRIVGGENDFFAIVAGWAVAGKAACWCAGRDWRKGYWKGAKEKCSGWVKRCIGGWMAFEEGEKCVMTVLKLKKESKAKDGSF